MSSPESQVRLVGRFIVGLLVVLLLLLLPSAGAASADGGLESRIRFGPICDRMAFVNGLRSCEAHVTLAVRANDFSAGLAFANDGEFPFGFDAFDVLCARSLKVAGKGRSRAFPGGSLSGWGHSCVRVEVCRLGPEQSGLANFASFLGWPFSQGPGTSRSTSSTVHLRLDTSTYDARQLLRVSRSLVATKPGTGPQLFDNLAPSDVARANGFQAIDASKLGNLTGKFNYVVLEDGTLVVAKRSYGHIDLANGGRVQAAGEVHIVNGEVRAINNASGHYKPSGTSAQGAAEGAFGSSGVKVRSGAYSETR
jgi:hypothetical protein